MSGEGTVHVEEEGWVRMGCRKGGEEGAFDGPVVGDVGGGEPVVEEGFRLLVVCWREPESRREGKIDLLEGAVGYVFDSSLQWLWEIGLEGVGVALQPAERGGHYDFIELSGFVLPRSDRDWHCRGCTLFRSRSANGCDLCREL